MKKKIFDLLHKNIMKRICFTLSLILSLVFLCGDVLTVEAACPNRYGNECDDGCGWSTTSKKPYYTCPDCGASAGSYQLDHSYSNTGSYRNNNNGTHSPQKKCSYCGGTTYGSASNCSYGSWMQNGGSGHYRNCGTCGYTQSDSHSFGGWYAPGGSDTYCAHDCYVCYYTYTGTHIFGNWYYNNNGTHSHKCSDCGHVVSGYCNSAEAYIANGYHWTQCSVCKGNDIQGAACTYQVELYGGSENNTCTTITVTYGQPVIPPTSAWINFTFTGWYTGTTSNGVKYFNNSSSYVGGNNSYFTNNVWTYFSTSGDNYVALKLYAGWDYTVKYDGNGHDSGSVSNQTFTWKNAKNLQNNIYYTQNTYNTSSTTSVTRYTANGKYDSGNSSNNGKGYYRMGHDFLGWSLSPTATAATWAPGQSVTDVNGTFGNCTLYAIWAPHVYTITYRNSDNSPITNANGSGDTSGTRYYTYKDDVDLSLLPSENTKGESYSFVGWGIQSNSRKLLNSMLAGNAVYEGSEKKFGSRVYNNATSSLYPPQNISLYAVYSVAVSDVDNAKNTVRLVSNANIASLTSDLLRSMYDGTNGIYTDLSLSSDVIRQDVGIYTYSYDILLSALDSKYGTSGAANAGGRYSLIGAFDNAGNGSSGIIPEGAAPTPPPTPETYKQTVNYYLHDNENNIYKLEESKLEYVVEYNTFDLKPYEMSYTGYVLDHIELNGQSIGTAWNATNDVLTDGTLTVVSENIVDIYYKVTSATLKIYANGYTDKGIKATDALFVITDVMTKNSDGSYYDPDTGFTISANRKYATKTYYTGENLGVFPAAELYGYNSTYSTLTVNGAYGMEDIWTLATAGMYDANSGGYIQTPASITENWWEYELNIDGSYTLDANGNRLRNWNIFSHKVYDDKSPVYQKDSNGLYNGNLDLSTNMVATLDTVRVPSTVNTKMTNSDLVAYMQWEAKDYKIYLDAGTNGGKIVGSEFAGEGTTVFNAAYGSKLTFQSALNAMSFTYDSKVPGESKTTIGIGAIKYQEGHEGDDSTYTVTLEDGTSKTFYRYRWNMIGWTLDSDPDATTVLKSLDVVKENMSTVGYVDDDGNFQTMGDERIVLYAVYSRDYLVEYNYYDSESCTNKKAYDIVTAYNTDLSVDLTLRDIADRVLTYENTETGEKVSTGDTFDDGTQFAPWITKGWTLNDTTPDAQAVGQGQDIFSINTMYESDYYHFYALYYNNITISFVTQTNDYITPYTGTAYYNASGNEKGVSFSLPGKFYRDGRSMVSWITSYPWPNCPLCGNDCYADATSADDENGCECKCQYPNPKNTTGCTCCYGYNDLVENINHDMTFTARWDTFPVITGYDKYVVTNELATMTEADLLEGLVGTDNEDVTTVVRVKDLDKILDELAGYKGDGDLDVIYTTTDFFGNVTQHKITIHITDTSTKLPDTNTYIRFLSNEYYKDENDEYVPTDKGGLEEFSLWITEGTRSKQLTDALNNADAAENGESYTYVYEFNLTYEEMQEAKEYLEENGYGKYSTETNENPLEGFIEKFINKFF